MPELELSLAEPPERPKNQQKDNAVVQPEFVVGMPVASASETSVDTQEGENPTPSAGTELPQFVVDQEAAQQALEADFTLHQQQFSELDTGTLQYVLEQFTTDKLNEVTALESAGLLLAIRDNSDVLVTPGEKLVLQDILESDTAVAERYWQEIYGSENPEELAKAIQDLAESDLQTDVSGSELQAVTAALSRQEAALQQLQEESPILAEAVQMVEAEQSRREGALASATEQVLQMEQEVDSTVQEIAEGATVDEVSHTGDQLEVTITNPDGSKKKTKVKEENLFGYMMLGVLSDVLLGTRNLDKMLDVWFKHKVGAPLLEKIGLDPQILFEQFGSDKYKAMDGILKTMSDHSCKQYFEQVIAGDYLYETLEILDPEHLKKIFNQSGTQKFGQSGFLGYDHLELPQELVDKMYDKLSPRQREILRIPVKNAVPQAAAEPAAVPA